jgi:hypothetical protein
MITDVFLIWGNYLPEYASEASRNSEKIVPYHHFLRSNVISSIRVGTASILLGKEVITREEFI